MTYSLKSENREFMRIATKFPTDFKFLGNETNFLDLGKLFKGSIESISAGGLMLIGPLTDRSWIPRFILQKIIIGVKFQLPDEDRQITALCRVAWITDDETSDSNNVKFGLAFKELSNGNQDHIFDFIINTQMK